MKHAAARVSASQASAWSSLVAARLNSMSEIAQAGAVMGFLPIAGEVDLSGLLDRCLGNSIRVALPAINWTTREMWPAAVTNLASDVEVTRHGIREPRTNSVVLVEELDVVLVPGLAFDREGGRLGRGAGFYDRFLSSPGLRATRIGVGFEWQMVDRVPCEGHDVMMEVVVTEAGVWRK